jgi:hypothetical protein
MNQWVDQIYQWTLHHPAETVVLFLAAAVIPLAIYFWSAVRTFVSFCWSWLKRSAQPSPALLSIRLDFVPIPSECRYAILKYENRLLTQISTYWHVTNSSKTNTPARLLIAELLSPRVDDPTSRCALWITGPKLSGPIHQTFRADHEIPSGETRKIWIEFYVDLRLHRENKPVKLTFAVTDQFSKVHRLRTKPLRPIDLTPKK